MLTHPGGYAILRYHATRRQPNDLATLLTQLGQLLLRRGWYRFLADNRQLTPLNEVEKAWFTTQWLGQGVARPAPLWCALILPTEVVARLSIGQMVQEADPATLHYRTFTETEPAEAYLASLPAPRR